MYGFLGYRFSTEKLAYLGRDLLANLVLFFFCLYIPTSKRENEKKICLPYLFANASRTSILLGRWSCIVTYYSYFTEWVSYVFLWGQVLRRREYEDSRRCLWRKERACVWEGKVANFFILPLQNNARQGQRVICYFMEQLWGNHGSNSDSLESS